MIPLYSPISLPTLTDHVLGMVESLAQHPHPAIEAREDQIKPVLGSLDGKLLSARVDGGAAIEASCRW
jgi:hypothetical protein